MSAYLDKIMSNHVFNSESSTDLSYLYDDTNKNKNIFGGNIETNLDDKPTGGFPPIFIVDIKEQNEDPSKNRQLGTNKVSGISIKDILNSKKR